MQELVAGHRRLAAARRARHRSRKSAISTKGTRRSRCWSARAASWSDRQALRSRARRHARRQSLHDAHGGRGRVRPFRSATSSSTISATTRGAKLGHHAAGPARPWAARTADDSRRVSTWPISAIRGSGAVNGVSRLHGEVSRQLFQPLFPRWPADEVPVGYVTNGVHVPTLGFGAGRCAVDAGLRQETAGSGTTEALEQGIRSVSRRGALAVPQRRAQGAGRLRARAAVARADGVRRCRRGGRERQAACSIPMC